MAIKDRLEELISSVHQCSTKDGVEEIQKLYTKKKQELGANITPMMDIRVRDAIRGKLLSFEKMSKSEAEDEQSKAEMKAQEELARKFDEGMHVVSEHDFFLHETVLEENAVDAVCIMDIECQLPTVGHKELVKSLYEACEHVGAFGVLYIGNKKPFLPISECISVLDSFGYVDVAEKPQMYAEVEKFIERGNTRVFAFVESNKVAEYRRIGSHFLRNGGHRFEIVEVKNKYPSELAIECINSDEFEAFCKLVPVSLTEAEKLYESAYEILEG